MLKQPREEKTIEPFDDSPLSLLAHEIRTPLSVLKIGIDNLEIDCTNKSNKDQRENIEVLKRSVEKLSGLITELINLKS